MQTFGCICECHAGFTGSLCETTIPTGVDDPCIISTLCTEVGQICESGFCICDTQNGYIKDEFMPSITYGECVGKVPACITDSDCFPNQDCVDGYCTCVDLGVGDMCLKGEDWVCVVDPLEVNPCAENPIGPCGYYGTCTATGIVYSKFKRLL